MQNIAHQVRRRSPQKLVRYHNREKHILISRTMSNKTTDCLTVAVGLEEGREVGVDDVGMDVGMELGVADGCANIK